MGDKQMPCGCCPSGTYAADAIIDGHRRFAGYPTRKAALAAAPRCIHRPAQICMGCRDFIVAFHCLGCPPLKAMLP
jgi:hypothetical protein